MHVTGLRLSMLRSQIGSSSKGISHAGGHKIDPGSLNGLGEYSRHFKEVGCVFFSLNKQKHSIQEILKRVLSSKEVC